MPTLFIGHGSPMNAIEDNEYSETWKKIGEIIPRPDMILSVSAHWYTKGSLVNDEKKPNIVYDMYGFPEELYDIKYTPPGSPDLAQRTMQIVSSAKVTVDNSWGIDHGTWSVLCRMFPDGDIPLIQLSVDAHAKPETHYQIGKELSALRNEGILILGSGNVVHNLGRINFSMEGKGFDWAYEFDKYIGDSIREKNIDNIINFHNAGSSAQIAFPYPDHFYPLLYVLGASDEKDKLSVFCESCTYGSLSMTSYLFE
jgi:4,5-DOPA dioxygenase extradiol